MAGKDNTSPSEMDKGNFFWVGLCGICHTGGGPGEFDRDGELLYDVASAQFGYEKLGKTAAQVTLDGDYAWIDTSTGDLKVAQWDVTGLSEPDCLWCHRSERTVANGKDMAWVWRAATLRAKHTLVDSQAAPVPAFAAAPTAAQGWFSQITMANTPPGAPPMATTLQIDYSVGVADGSLKIGKNNQLTLAGTSIIHTPRDRVCWGCHAVADQKKRGRVWFDPTKDVHYAAFNHYNDADPSNDIEDTKSQACARCHPSEIDHLFAKGSAFAGSVADYRDYVDFRMCVDCHTPGTPKYEPGAPAPTSEIHTQTHLNTMSCQFCHIPFKQAPTMMVVDNTVTGSTVAYFSETMLSADPLNPSDPDKSRWYPSAKLKTDPDGHRRLYPDKLLLTAWWGDWDDNGTPNVLSDDTIEPVILWRMRNITSNAALPGVVDDNGDGIPEVNTPAEMLIYMTALQGNDTHGNQVAARPVLVRGEEVYYADAGSASGVSTFKFEGSGIPVEAAAPFSTDHNVLPASVALGSRGCIECHRNINHGNPTEVFDRLIPVDPFDVTTAAPIYAPLREVCGVDPF